MSEVNEKNIERWFDAGVPNAGQSTRYEAIRKSARELALTILHNTPEGPDQTDAIRKLRECVGMAHEAILREGLERTTTAGR